VKLALWDTAGAERFESISTLYYRGAHAALLCVDATSRSHERVRTSTCMRTHSSCSSCFTRFTRTAAAAAGPCPSTATLCPRVRVRVRVQRARSACGPAAGRQADASPARPPAIPQVLFWAEELRLGASDCMLFLVGTKWDALAAKPETQAVSMRARGALPVLAPLP
jgi:GTPase SAR1 family protein